MKEIIDFKAQEKPRRPLYKQWEPRQLRIYLQIPFFASSQMHPVLTLKTTPQMKFTTPLEKFLQSLVTQSIKQFFVEVWYWIQADKSKVSF